MVKKYIDISTYQGNVDFSQVKGNVDGVIIRAGYGQNNIDAKFERNISECNRLSIPCGVYWFSYACTEEMARKEAEYCLAAIKPYRVELPVCFDFEYDSVEKAKKNYGVTISKSLATKLVHAFCDTIEKAGYYAMNYANKDYLNRYFDESTLKYDLWLAAWPTQPDPKTPPRKDVGIWQYSSKGSVPGIVGNVDMDWAYKDYPAIIKAAGLNNLNKKDEPWYAEAQKWAIANGISDGDREKEPATRAEVWAMLQRLNNIIGGNSNGN